ncbi:UNVERIFIED_CONTAM: hypothetical protein Scaly_0414700 [Sesamum calycinum]|uniref:SOSEKI DIX-like domain-containing protein n=1 Tax=Sesamum calycinum TaxID=2727403 RepID=A0AAW2SDH5_9LAMI
MEGRMKKYRQLSPERAKESTTRASPFHGSHYFFPDGLYLRDLMFERQRNGFDVLLVLSYKNGYVWHDLCYDDLSFPHRNDVLKVQSSFKNPILKLDLALKRGVCFSRPSSRLSNGIEELNTLFASLLISRVTRAQCWEKFLLEWFLSLTEYKVYKSESLADASAQTEGCPVLFGAHACTRNCPNDDGLLEKETSGSRSNQVPGVKDSPEISRDFVSPLPQHPVLLHQVVGPIPWNR